MADSLRPDPDQLLNRIKEDEARSRRGKLKIFFGASAGVGKTYAMLQAARQLREQGLDVVVGLAETHGRKETAALLEGIELLPRKEIPHRDRVLWEFDLDGALTRRPALVLVDELAHSNAPGCRHPKRWQDVEELLDAGIDVFTTINVQHLESLNDIVGGLTGIRVWETVPDRVFDVADEVVLVDLPPDDLLQRLKEGKVYLPDQAERAIENFFRKGNLIALRELALRRTADQVDDEMQSYRQQAGGSARSTREALLVCVGPEPGADTLVRAASRLAGKLDCEWHALYVETPALQRLAETRRQAILNILKLAQDLGAHTATLAATDAPLAVVEYARQHRLAQLVVGRSRSGCWWQWQQPFAAQLARLAPDLDLLVTAQNDAPRRAVRQESATRDADQNHSAFVLHGYLAALVFCLGTALLATPLLPYFDRANIVMLFLLAVVGTAVRYGRGPAVLAAIANVAAFDVFFVEPRFSFAIHDWQYLLTFLVMLIVGLIVGQLTARFRYQAYVASAREQRTRHLYEMARELSGALVVDQVVEIGERCVEASFRIKARLLLPDEHDRLPPPPVRPGRPKADMSIAQWCFDRNAPAGIGTDTLPAASRLYLPLKAPMRTRGVLMIAPEQPRWLLIPEQRRLLDTFAALIAIALERVHFVTVARDTLVKMEAERQRNSLLAALSHDLRTPLTALIGLAETLALELTAEQSPHSEPLTAIHQQAVRMSLLVNNLLDMAKLQAGGVRLRKDWQSLEELVGAAVRTLEQALRSHPLRLELDPMLPLVNCDAVLIERVLANLLENATKYTPPGTVIGVTASTEADRLIVEVWDEGPGLPTGREQVLFEKFTRGHPESAAPGVGLGLAICRLIVEAHGGEIRAENRASGGASFVFTLPLETPPPVEETEDAPESP
ncbi:two-component system sensor histidine kinase KdpD [Candidatus Contendibacter odensensis]|uniref:histidine kinase n=1 Tax=Candidatus Contendobacter odensis Run_B_J11 TaxID=1400861 RepID=A0A7U7J4X7_9GAMM|nr:two-component system sensor histidine kinase KdpD [Candidatus Contendobacter odensis]CDH46130.1 sensory histidine kinase in two-component regulatory system wtih KdpE, regulation of potassium translocation [Candidatus Contendobacter odensis Run_B_J11]